MVSFYDPLTRKIVKMLSFYLIFSALFRKQYNKELTDTGQPLLIHRPKETKGVKPRVINFHKDIEVRHKSTGDSSLIVLTIKL